VLTVAVTLAALAAMVVWGAWVIVHVKNLTSTPPSPTPSTTPTPASDDVALKMMTTALHAMSTESEATRQMVVDLVQGRPLPTTTGPSETAPTLNELPLIYDYDSTPLSPGIEAVLAREEAETTEAHEQARLRTERIALQEKMMQAQANLDRFESGQSSPQGEPSSNGSSNETSPRHAASD
jgi:hypothetical protein